MALTGLLIMIVLPWASFAMQNGNGKETEKYRGFSGSEELARTKPYSYSLQDAQKPADMV